MKDWPLVLIIAVLSAGVLLAFKDFDKRLSGKESREPRAVNHGFEIRQMYLNRVAQFHREELNARQFRDSLAVDVDTYFINNPNIR